MTLYPSSRSHPSCWICRVGLLALVSVTAFRTQARADADVPARLQAELIGKLAAFDRNLPARAKGTVRILVLHKNADGRSERFANEVALALGNLPAIAGLKQEVRAQAFVNATELASRCKSLQISVVYLAPGLESEMLSVAKALAGLDIMSVGPNGSAVGFVLEESKPRIVVNLTIAKNQNVALRAQVLKLARIVE